ncbi:MAG TPA: UDP-3-O-(3-hydroxymyristoyl)glucosamine N-acyltransferase [Cytophagales bacterium]|nr:UDP-3-O-(3-hydroxymyristoyl)glucosamine N-acyltransferase [Cytophagales bacterium]HAA22607.1 UDP-3-O-(3-hydroxymyristoyl)glucosamine N-acyltransferase [Cytophagales bacterium]HAP63553.1 UDP-3-O-(3-hydroxymyristoyl)glucosamine N-acyltransferase [Cytophagales bacterium]
MKFSLQQIADLIGGIVEGDTSAEVWDVAKIEEGKPGSISFLSNPKYEPEVYRTEATAVVVAKDFTPSQPISASLIRVEDPYVGFTQLLEAYAQQKSMAVSGIEEPSFLGEGSQVGDGHYRGAFSYIGKHCTIGNNVKIYPQAYIGDNVHIGDNTIIYSGAKIYADCVIGARCVLHAGAVIGSDGFGFAPQKDGTYKTIPQLGNVVLEDDVSVGANTTIDCATLGSTLVKQGTKLDNLVQVGHNVEIGKHTVMAAQVGIAGSATIGDQCMFGGQVGVGGHITVANGSKVGAQAAIPNDVKEENKNWLGSPIQPMRENIKSLMVFKSLPDLSKRVKQLEQKVLTLRDS